MTDTTDLLADLVVDGATVDLPDGRSLRVRIESDPDYSINDYDSDGRVAWVKHGAWTDHDDPRPQGFTGRARKLCTFDGERFWWEPYEGLTKEQVDTETWRIRELMTFGFHGIILELLDGEDAYGRPIVVEQASLWGIDDVSPEFVCQIVGELVGEILP